MKFSSRYSSAYYFAFWTSFVRFLAWKIDENARLHFVLKIVSLTTNVKSLKWFKIQVSNMYWINKRQSKRDRDERQICVNMFQLLYRWMTFSEAILCKFSVTLHVVLHIYCAPLYFKRDFSVLQDWQPSWLLTSWKKLPIVCALLT